MCGGPCLEPVGQSSLANLGYIVMAQIVMASLGVAQIVMASLGMAETVMATQDRLVWARSAYIVMACIIIARLGTPGLNSYGLVVTACIVLASLGTLGPGPEKGSQ